VCACQDASTGTERKILTGGCTCTQHPNTRCHGHRNFLAKFTEDTIKLMLVPDWASATPEHNVLHARYVNMEVLASACAR